MKYTCQFLKTMQYPVVYVFTFKTPLPLIYIYPVLVFNFVLLLYSTELFDSLINA